jgi:predicted nucleic acid-binding protein
VIVVDTNVLGYLFLSSKRSGQAERALLRDPSWAAPPIWRSEMRNVLALYVRKRLLPLEAALQVMREAESLMHFGEYGVGSASVLRLAAASGCSAYDCEFVALARELRAPLVTVDRKILAGFPDTAVSLQDFAGHRA